MHAIRCLGDSRVPLLLVVVLGHKIPLDSATGVYTTTVDASAHY